MSESVVGSIRRLAVLGAGIRPGWSLPIAVLLFLLFGCRSTGAGRGEATRPNLVVVLVDDLGWHDTELRMHATEAPFQWAYRTPNVLRLAAEGMVFTQAYAAAPVCTPSRISLLTGQSPARHGSTYWILHQDRDTSAQHPTLEPPSWNVNGLQPGAVTLPGLLADSGYRTIHVGKAHLGALGTPGADPTALGFDVNIAGHGAGAPGSYLGREGFGRLWEGGNHVWDVPGLGVWHGEDVFLTDVLAENAVRELRAAHADGEPFFLHLAPYAVHTPITAHPELVADRPGLPPIEAAYASMIEAVDRLLGRVLVALDELEIADETLIVFTSDNGGLSAHTRAGTKHTHNAPLRSGKGAIYEGGIRVPLVMRWPGRVQGGATSAQLSVSHDLFATLLSAAGVDVPRGHEIDAIDLTPALSGAVLPERGVLWHMPHFWGANGPGIEPSSALRVGREKLIWFHADDRYELYDVVSDSQESRDLTGERPERVVALAQRLRERLRVVGAGLSAARDS